MVDNAAKILSKVAIVETSVYDVLAYHADCLTCGWKSRRFDKLETAVKHGNKHAERKHAPVALDSESPFIKGEDHGS